MDEVKEERTYLKVVMGEIMGPDGPGHGKGGRERPRTHPDKSIINKNE